MSGPDDIQEERVRERLRALRVEPADDGFATSLRQRLVAAGPPAEPRPWFRRWPSALTFRRWAWPAAGVAAGLAVFLAVSVVHDDRAPGRRASGDPIAAVAVPSSSVALVRVNLSAEVAVASADLQVSLPPGLVFWSEGQALAQRTFEWQQPLAAGRNEIPIAVRGERPGRYTLRITARIGSTVVEHEVPLEVTSG